jgi:uncharacterized membrane protein
MAAQSSQNNFIVLIAALLLLISIFLLWKYEEFRELSIVFLILMVVGVMLLRYYED